MTLSRGEVVDKHEQIIRGLPLLARLPGEDLQALAVLGRVREYPSGAVVFNQGDSGDALYVIIEGQLRISLVSPSGEESTLALMGPGEACGDLALLDGRPRSASAIATGHTRTLVITREEFIRWLSGRPRAALALLETLSLLVRRKDEAMSDLAFVELSLRLAKRLLDLASDQEMHVKRGRSDAIRLRITQRNLAAMLGVTRESVNKELNRFARKRWIALGRGSVAVRDFSALRGFVYGDGSGRDDG